MDMNIDNNLIPPVPPAPADSRRKNNKMFLKNSARSSILIKMFAIGILALLLLIPTSMITDLIKERANRKNEAIAEVYNKWGNQQIVAGPVLTIPYTITDVVKTETENGVKTSEEKKTNYVNFLPETLNYNGEVATNLLKRGIYEITVYNSKLKVEGEFAYPDFSSIEITKEKAEIKWDEAHVSFSLSDLKALQQNLELVWDDKKYNFKPGFKINETGVALKGSGLSAFVPISKDEKEKKYKFSFDIDINGSDSIKFVPLGRVTNVDLTSNWPSPSFDGAFLPDERNITEDGFEAKWKILELNRDYPQVWEGNLMQDIQASSFGARLIVMVDEYQKNTRSVKYAVMFIALSFIVFFFVEVLNQIRIHPIQYILVGLSLVLFFSLLLSITEHLNFNLAYLISSVATIVLVTLYSKTIFKNTRLTLVQGGILTTIYIFIYTIIQMEDYSLLFGSIGLFIVLAIVMYISRKIDWYSVSAKTLGDDK